ncbi:MAG: Y-family DNA polymerase [Planctomycetaceae bacterium]
MPRVLCLWFPDWPLQRLCAARPELKGRPIVLFDESPRGGYRVTHSSCREIFKEMPLAEAKALSPQAQFEPHDRSADSECLQVLAVECQRFSPSVGIGDEASLLMDVTGCTHLFEGEQPLARQVARFVARLKLVGKVSIADTVGAAWGVCRYGRAGVVSRGENETALYPLPVAALRLSASIVETLDELGIQTIGQLRALPRQSLASRFGTSVANRLDQAFGRLPELIVSVRGTEPIQASQEFDEPLTDRRSLELVLYQLIEHVAAALRNRQLGVQQLTCQIDDVSFTIGATGPTAAGTHLWELARLHLERLALSREVRRVEVRAGLTARRVEQQPTLLDERVDPRELQHLLDRLSSRLGDGALFRADPAADPLPEFASRLVSVLNEVEQRAATTDSTGRFRPLRLYARPVPVEVLSVVPDGPPIRFRWKTAEHAVNRHWGPERVASGWWRGEQVKRDYYRVETAAGERFWLFRTAGAWFLHGVFE